MFLLYAAMAIAQQPGSLDPTFGNGGKLTFGTSFGPLEYPQGFGIATQPDGKIVVAGKDTIARLNPDGSFDTTFGNGTGQVAGCCEINYLTSIALQPDGKIVTAGGYEADASDFWFLVARHNPDGSLDTSFGNKGHVTTPSSGYARSVNIQKDGRIVVVGTHWYGQIQRYNADGTLDSSFGGGDGIVDRTELGYSYQFYASTVQEDGKIIAVGELWNGPNYYDIAVFRFMPDGSVDTGFGSDGIATSAIGPYSDSAYSVAIQSDGKIVVAGAANNVPGGPFETPNRDFAIARFNSNGSRDTGFGTIGAVRTPINTGDDAARAVRIQSDGRIAVAGYSDDSLLIYDFALVRYHTSGALDTTFGGGDGITTLDFDNAQDRAYGMALDSQGRAVVGGASSKGDSLGVFALARFFLNTAAPETITVTNTNDSGAGSLRQAIADAVPGSTIDFDPNVFATSQIITLTSGHLVIDKNLTINGPGATLLSISGNNATNMFNVKSGVMVTLNGMTIRDGRAEYGGAIQNNGALTVSYCTVSGNTAISGGAIFNVNGSILTINSSTVSGNSAAPSHSGGGIFNFGSITVSDSAISGNTAYRGGGVVNTAQCDEYGVCYDSTAHFINSTISGNTGGGVLNSAYCYNGACGGGIAHFINSAVVGNTTSGIWSVNDGGIAVERLWNTILGGNTGGDISGTIETASHNLIGDPNSSGGIVNGVNGNIVGVNPLLGPLQNNGGPTMTHALRPGSPAINAGDNCVLTENGCGDGNPALPTDQRGMPRNGTVDIGAFERQANDISYATRFDFDGDGRTDISVYRPSNGNWYVLNSSSDPSYSITNWGASTDIQTPADLDNDGKTDIAVYRPSTGEWFVVNSSDSSFTVTNWGAVGDRPLAGDFDGDGRADISVYRPSEGTWYIFRSDGTGWDIVQWGAADDIPVPAKYDSDNKTDIAVHRPSTGEWFVLPSMGTGYAVNWGTSGDNPVAADYDGDGKGDIAVYRPSDGNWYILKSSTNNSQADVISWGAATDIPVPGDYDGDGRADVAQFRPSTGDWFVLRSTSGYDVVNWGIATDKPVPAAYTP
jgi:uncharacterized delta-60 repeat protein